MITKISKGYKITIPSKYREELNISEDDKVEWNINANGNLEIRPIKRKHLSDLIGIASDSKWDALESTEKAGRGE